MTGNSASTLSINDSILDANNESLYNYSQNASSYAQTPNKPSNASVKPAKRPKNWLPAAVQPHFAFNHRPSIVSVLVPFEGQLFTLPIEHFDASVTLSINQASVSINAAFRNIASFDTEALLVVPLKHGGAVRECIVEVNQSINQHDRPVGKASTIRSQTHTSRRARPFTAHSAEHSTNDTSQPILIDTLVVDQNSQLVQHTVNESDQTHHQPDQQPNHHHNSTVLPPPISQASVIPDHPATSFHSIHKSVRLSSDGSLKPGRLPPMNYADYIPNLYRLPIPHVKSNQSIYISINYVETLPFMQGSYHFTLPMSFHSDLLLPNRTFNQTMNLSVNLIGIGQAIRYESTSHSLSLNQSEPQHPQIELDVVDFDFKTSNSPKQPATSHSVDFEFLYSNTVEQIGTICLMQTPEDSSFQSMTHSPVPSPTATPNEPESSNSLNLPIIPDHPNNNHNGSITDNSRRSSENRAEPAPVNQSIHYPIALCITPPAIESINQFFRRNVVYIVDRSASMQGEVYRSCSRAISQAINNLKPADAFSVITFDHALEQYSHELVSVTPSNAASAATFLRAMRPNKGGTNIGRALRAGLSLFDPIRDQQGQVDYLVLATDGSTQDEREIIDMVQKHVNEYPDHVFRILTMGIGRHVNAAFLKYLSMITRGASTMEFNRTNIYSSFDQLMQQHATPVLTDLQLTLPASSNPQITQSLTCYPAILPDLYVMASVCISGAIVSSTSTQSISQSILALPHYLILTGHRADRSVFSCEIPVRPVQAFDVSQLFAVERISHLTSQAWLDNTDTQLCINESIKQRVACPFTRVVAIENPPQVQPESDHDAPLSDEKLAQAMFTSCQAGTSTALLIGATSLTLGNPLVTQQNLSGADDYLSHVEKGCCVGWDLDCNECMQC